MVEIIGDAGMGKTRLLFEFSKRCPDDLQLLQSTTPRPGQSTPFWTWQKLIERTNGTEERASAQTTPPGPDSAEAHTTPSAPPASEASRAATFQAWLDRIDVATNRKPAVVAIDDAHRLDPDSCLLLYWLAETIDDRPLLLPIARCPLFTMHESEEIFSDIGRIDRRRQEMHRNRPLVR